MKKTKIISSIMALVLLFTTILPLQTFADDLANISDDATICKEIGVLKGDNNGVTSDYLQQRPTRLQSAIMFLRLKGLEDEALNYSGTNNFSDANSVLWEQGRNVLAYLKANPDLGWIGTNGAFKPNDLIDSNSYYKVLLETLGYKQTTGTTNGDFEWADVIAFAASKGLTKVAGKSNFTVNDLATATVEALKTNTKTNNKSLINNLVETGVVNKDSAKATNLYIEQVTTDAKGVTVVSNTKIEVEFVDVVDKVTAENISSYNIKSGNTSLAINSAYLLGNKKVILEVAPLTVNKDYTLSVNNKSFSFKGVGKDNTAPKLINVAGTDNNIVEVTFDRLLDVVSAQTTSIYTIKDIEITSATIDESGVKVILTTSGLQRNRSYDIKVNGIKNADGVSASSQTKRFTAKSDTTAPSLSSVTVLNNVRILLTFTDANGLDKTIAEDKNNYSITSGSDTLAITDVKVLDKDSDDYYESVELTTETQTYNKSYTLKVNNIADNSISKNKISREIKRDFKGKNKDTSSPTIEGNPVVITDNMLEIRFKDANALDVDTATDLNNYSINNGLDIVKIEIKDTNDLYSNAGKTVLITTSEMEKSKSYTIEISGVCDEFGNDMSGKSGTTVKKLRFTGRAKDLTPPYVVSISSIDKDTITIVFDDKVNEESAENKANYRINDLAMVTKASLDSTTEKKVTLTTATLTADKEYTIELNGIEDIAGNKLENVEMKFITNSSSYDTEPAEVDYIEAINKEEIYVHFADKIKATTAELRVSGITFSQVGSLLEDETTIVMKASSSMSNTEYKVTTLTGVTDFNNSAYVLEDNLTFYGNDNDNDDPEVESIEQIDVITIRAIFTEPVLKVGAGVGSITGYTGSWTATVNPDGDSKDTEEGFRTIDYVASSKLPVDKDIAFNFSNIVTDYIGATALDEEDTSTNKTKTTIITTYMEDEEKPEVDSVDAVTANKVVVSYNEDLKSAGGYRITYQDDNSREKTVSISKVEIDIKDKSKINIITSNDLSSEYDYTLKVTSAATDIAGNRESTLNESFDFVGVDIKSVDYIQGLKIVDANTFRVIKSNRISNVESVYELNSNGSTIGSDILGSSTKIKDNEYEVVTTSPLLKNVSYKLVVDSVEYTFNGFIEDDSISVSTSDKKVKFGDMNTSTQTVEVFRENSAQVVINETNGEFVIDASEFINAEDVLYVYVKRTSDNVILYGARIVVEGDKVSSPYKAITAFSFAGLNPVVNGTINEGAKTITLNVPNGTNVTNLVATFTSSTGSNLKIGATPQVSGTTANDFTSPVTYTVTAENASTTTYTVTVNVALNSAKNIVSFSLDGLNPVVNGTVNNTNHTIALAVPYGTDVTALVPTINISPNATVSPNTGVAQDFTSPVTYTVTAQDTTTQTYTVTVTENPNTEKLFNSFGIKTPYAFGVVDNSAHTIAIKVPFGTDITNLVAEFSVSDNASVKINSTSQVSGTTANDFTSPITYIVTAEDASTQNYVVTVSVALETEKAITAFSFVGLNPVVNGTINEGAKTITLNVPNATDVTNLIATFATTGQSVSIGATPQVSRTTANDFTSPVTYTVTAQDSSTSDYTVTVNVLP